MDTSAKNVIASRRRTATMPTVIRTDRKVERKRTTAMARAAINRFQSARVPWPKVGPSGVLAKPNLALHIIGITY